MRHSDTYRGLKKGYKVIFTFPSAEKLYAALLVTAATEALLLPQTRLPLAATAAVTHTLLLLDRRLYTPRRVAGLTLYLLAVAQPVIFSGATLQAVSAATLILAVVTATLQSPRIGGIYAAASLLAASQNPMALALDAAALAAIAMLLWRIDNRIRGAVNTSGIRLLNAFFQYILAGRKWLFERELLSLSRERLLTLHAYRLHDPSETPILDLIVSEIHPGPFRDIGSSTLPQLLMRRPVTTCFLKAPASHSEDLTLTSDAEKAVKKLENSLEEASHKSVYAGITSLEGDIINVLAMLWDEAPPLLFIKPQVPLEDLPPTLTEKLHPAVLVDTHSIIDKDYILLKEGTLLYAETLAETMNALHAHTTPTTLRAAALKIDYSDGIEVAPGGIVVAAIEAGGAKTLLVCIDGNNMDPHFQAKLRGQLRKLADHVVLATTDTHLYSGALSGVEYKPVGSSGGQRLIPLIAQNAEKALNALKPASASYVPVPIKAKYLDGEALAKISIETEKNLKDGAKIFALATLYPTLLLVLQNLGDSLPVLINHALNLLHILLG